MKIKDYLKNLQKLAKKYPDADVITSSDEEGNRFEKVFFVPSAVYFSNGEIITELDAKEGCLKLNAICLN